MPHTEVKPQRTGFVARLASARADPDGFAAIATSRAALWSDLAHVAVATPAATRMGQMPTASTLLGVQRLAFPAMMVEIEAPAAK